MSSDLIEGRIRIFDALTKLQDSATLTSSAAGQVDGSAQVLDMGKNTKTKCVAVFDISAIKVSANDEVYELSMQGSSKSDFSSDFTEIACVRVGAPGSFLPGDVTPVAERYIVRFENTLNGNTYRYIRGYIGMGGTAPSITVSAYVSPE